MKKFHFRLEAVERHRKLQEQDKQVALAKSLEKMRGTESRLLDLDMKEVQARRDFAGLGSPGRQAKVSASDFWMLDQFIRGQKVRRLDLKQQLEIDEQAVGNAYRDFLRARQQKKIMEKLKEKKLAQFKEEGRKHDNRAQDEQYVMRNRLRQGRDEDPGENNEE
jgi:flagellar FliJ protein